ncbi:MAG: hypothetical protein RhofKO_35150 [Rhodothermales bacterium]
MRRLGFWIGIGLLSLVGCGEEPVDFNAEVRPILNDRCLACHGGVKQASDFSMLFPEEAYQPAASGKHPIVPGRPGQSELLKRVAHTDPGQRMPPDGPALSDDEIDVLQRWIDQGGEWETHWAFIPPEQPGLPEVSDADWARQPFDAFVLAKLDAEGLAPNAEAECSRLLRRVSLDLIGLPPTPEDTDRFCADPSDAAYAAEVERLLDSPHYGERWTAMWMDLARYADTKGYERDPHRDIWRYRDWLIDAFNRDLPFDQFTIEQLAGDLLPEATTDQLLATAFHRNTMGNTEGGTNDEEFRVAAVFDRVNTTFEVWQGITMSCVQCHAHPYDPIRHDEFFQVYAAFNNTEDFDRGDDAPHLKEYEPEQEAAIREQLAQLQAWGAAPETFRSTALSEQIHEAVYTRLRITPSRYDTAHAVYSESEWITEFRSTPGAYIQFDDLDLSQTRAFWTDGSHWRDGATMEIVLDSLSGPVIGEVAFTKQEGRHIGRVPIQPTEGTHDVFFVFDRTKHTGGWRLHWLYQEEQDAGLTNEVYAQVVETRLTLANTTPERMTPILRERPAEESRTTHRFERGNWLTPVEVVPVGVPHALGDLPKNAPQNRLGVAQWLVDDDNPLTARVIVNRYWAQFFGQGLVETLEDFGTQGAAPSHPALLDYLAYTFMHEDDWHLKALFKRIVTSSTYRQSTAASPEKHAADPFNVWLSRGPRMRLSAEQIRDQALAIGGLLSDETHGKSVMPPQPEGIWNSPYNGAQWTESTDGDQYRRGLYTYWKRTSPYPSMLTFDAPTREVCVSRRVPTNTPLQALVTLNDPVFTEAAQGLASRMLLEADADLNAQLRHGYRLALQREPDAVTLADLRALYADATTHFAQQPEAAQQTTPFVRAAIETAADTPAETAALTTVAHTLLNLDAVLMKD